MLNQASFFSFFTIKRFPAAKVDQSSLDFSVHGRAIKRGIAKKPVCS